MRFSSREDIEGPIEEVFQSVTDFDGFERQALRRGAEVSRKDALGTPGAGSEWRLKFTFRGKQRDVYARMVKFDGPNGFEAETQSGGLEGTLSLDLVALSPRRTRLQVSMDLRARTLAGRLLLQSLKFARGNLNKRFANRVWQFAQTVETKHTKVG